jgi:hypothetical protein
VIDNPVCGAHYGHTQTGVYAVYYLIVSRPVGSDVWFPQFGDRDRSCVKDELRDIKTTDKRNGDKNEYKIIPVKTAHGHNALKAVEALNNK